MSARRQGKRSYPVLAACTHTMEAYQLEVIDGGNPLGFLAALGAAVTSRSFVPDVQMSWRLEGGAWRPMLLKCETHETRFIRFLQEALNASSPAPFEIDAKLPFAAGKFAAALRNAQQEAAPWNRRLADLLAAFGSEIYQKDGMFEDTLFRMVRSGDSAGQGLPAYAIAIRDKLDEGALRRALFEPWDYRDEGFSLRWDPIEDQRYALRWYDPSPQTNKKFGPKSMLGANALALEALSLFPTVPTALGLTTTGFGLRRRRDVFTWPIWDCELSLDVVRSLLALPELSADDPPRAVLAAQGILEIYRCERIAANQYDRNFTPAAAA